MAPLRRRSLAVKIPLLISVLLLSALAAMSVASYWELRTALIDIAAGRLQQAADQMANVFALSSRQRLTAMKQLMDRPEVREFVRTRDASLQPKLEADVRSYLGTAAAIANVEILEDEHAATLDADARHHLERVKLNARRMGQLIDDLLSFSQIGRTTVLRQIVDVAAVARAAAQEVIAGSARQIELSIEALAPSYGEAALLTQVFTNLVSNAVKFTAKADAPAIWIGSKTADHETVYFVRDNGVGFDDRYAEKLFGVFQRLHRQDEFEGTGVGLAIVHRIISRHRGRVWAEGRMNAGATFYFTLPKASTVAKAMADETEVRPA